MTTALAATAGREPAPLVPAEATRGAAPKADRDWEAADSDRTMLAVCRAAVIPPDAESAKPAATEADAPQPAAACSPSEASTSTPTLAPAEMPAPTVSPAPSPTSALRAELKEMSV